MAIVQLQSPVVAFTRCPHCGNDKKLTTTGYFHKEKRRVTPRLTSKFANAMKTKNTNTEPYLLPDPMNNAIALIITITVNNIFCTLFHPDNVFQKAIK